ncbi:uncharacterized protein LOC144432963 [Glandiceps talaboti]
MKYYKTYLVFIICLTAAVLEIFIFLPMDFELPSSSNRTGKTELTKTNGFQMLQNSLEQTNEKEQLNMSQSVFEPNKSILPKRQEMENRYLFPVVNFNGGPNFQYRQFKIAIQMAVNTSRTIVLPDFKHHRTRAHEGRVTFEETFDVELFDKFIPVTTIDEFKAKCGLHVDNVITAPHLRDDAFKLVAGEYRRQRAWLEERVGVEIPGSESIPRTWLEYNRLMKKLSKADCAVLIAPNHLEKSYFPHKQEVADAMDKYLIRTTFLRKAVKEVIPRLCEGKPILGFHWRNKTGEQCRVGHLGEENSPRCINLSQSQQDTIKTLLKDINEIIEQYEIGCMFVAHAPGEDSKDFMDVLFSNYSSSITIDDVINLRHPGIDSYGGDDYFISLIEQEICARSQVFIGNGNSNWSTFVFRERQAFEKGPNYDIITDFQDIKDDIKVCY